MNRIVNQTIGGPNAPVNMPSGHKLRRWGLGAALVLALCGCHHPTPSGPRRVARVLDGDPATNVMIVPASAMWRARGGATNLVASGIVPGRAFPFPDYDEPLVKSVYARWLELLK